MQEQDPLAQLAPLRLPQDPSWWPPAPLWWVLAGLLALLLGAALWLWWRSYRARRYRRRAVAALDRLQSEWPADRPAEFAIECNRLLKSVALRSFPPREVAALSGAPWRDFLNRSARSPAPLFAGELDGLYRAVTPGPAGRETLYRACRRWIQTHRVAR